jgi:hypothetical protein
MSAAETITANAKSAAQRAWVRRVLGVELPVPGAQGGGADIGAARAAWTQAMEQVDAQIAALQAALRKSDDPVLRDIAEFGLNGVTGHHKVRVMAALHELGSGPPTASAAAKALGVIEPFRTHLETDDRVAACDENPFGAAVSIRATLVPPLAMLQRALREAAD